MSRTDSGPRGALVKLYSSLDRVNRFDARPGCTAMEGTENDIAVIGIGCNFPGGR